MAVDPVFGHYAVFARSIALSDELSRGDTAEAFKSLAMTSAEIGLINQVLQAGKETKNWYPDAHANNRS